MTSSNAGMEARARASLTEALALLDQAESSRFTSRFRPQPKFKPLVLQAEPLASVRRVGTWAGRQVIAVAYECFIGEQRITVMGCDHSTSHKAWICLARYIAAGGAIR